MRLIPGPHLDRSAPSLGSCGRVAEASLLHLLTSQRLSAAETVAPSLARTIGPVSSLLRLPRGELRLSSPGHSERSTTIDPSTVSALQGAAPSPPCNGQARASVLPLTFPATRHPPGTEAGGLSFDRHRIARSPSLDSLPPRATGKLHLSSPCLLAASCRRSAVRPSTALAPQGPDIPGSYLPPWRTGKLHLSSPFLPAASCRRAAVYPSTASWMAHEQPITSTGPQYLSFLNRHGL
jgi:hypothetical protein